ncbi:hypothetical protein NG796_03090 [Laspinema sp. A4]|uniref:hypothetical protein n=1 Tax=Laspinema sp. D2d TaxID=2953686 RepID=UPI0021BB1C58|nr:hypothetical protein [Laspinema sp. D2d]MCT7982273.1 hypothetical protein [Laspinema sp. D2d]
MSHFLALAFQDEIQGTKTRFSAHNWQQNRSKGIYTCKGQSPDLYQSSLLSYISKTGQGNALSQWVNN